MTWKKSKDGGLDYDVSQEIKKEKLNPFVTAFTTTFNLNNAILPLPKSRKLQIQDKIKILRNTR